MRHKLTLRNIVVIAALHFRITVGSAIISITHTLKRVWDGPVPSIVWYTMLLPIFTVMGSSWLWSYGSWIYNYICIQCLSPLPLCVRILLRRGVLNATLCDEVCQWLTAGRWFSSDILVSSTNKTDPHNTTEILLKVALSTINQTNPYNKARNDHSKWKCHL